MSDVITYPLSAAIELCKQLDNDTPETDANTWSDSSEGVLFKVVSVEFARRLERERDEAREKYATEATEHMLAVNKLCNERDEAREEIKRLKVILDLIKKDVS
jgi:predicted GIY-YIG superfamily endonuclease